MTKLGLFGTLPVEDGAASEQEMSQIKVTLPDGSQKVFESGVTVLDVARSIGPRLAQAAVVAKVDGRLVDLTARLESDASVAILTERDPEALQVYRHSSAHLLALAVIELFPGTQLGIGPPIENGFYYDFQRECSLYRGGTGRYPATDAGVGEGRLSL